MAQIVDPLEQPKGFVTQNVTTAAGLSTVPSYANVALIQAEDGDLRWRDDGTDPTASEGMLISMGTTVEYTGDLDAIKLISVSGAAVKTNTAYSRRES